MALPGKSRVDRYGNIYRTLGSDSPDFGFKTDWDAVRAKNAELEAYLGKTDYSAQTQEANEFAKLQFALSLMGRGFASMGAAPGPGESPAGTLGRTLVAPLAGDISTIAGPLMKQRAATRLAEQQEERQRKMAAYTATAASAKEPRALAERLLGDDPKAGAPKISDTGIFREITALSSDGVPTFGPQIETKAVFSDGKMRQFRVDSGTEIKVGDTPGTYRRYEKPTGTAGAPRGLDDPKFQASFRGMLAQVAQVQRKGGLGNRSVRFNSTKFGQNPDLKPGADFPIEKVVGVNQQDGSVTTAPLSLDEQKTYAENLRSSYLNKFDAIKTGEEPANLNNTFIARELSKSLEDLGLEPSAALPAGVTKGREQITNPREITAAYVAAVPGFATDLQGTLDNLPFGADNANLRTGTARLVLGNELGVPFGPLTVSPAPLPANSDAVAVKARSEVIRRELDAGDIQQRVIFERLAKGTSLGSKLRTSTADSRDKQLAVVNKEFDAEKERLRKALSNPGAAKDIEVLDKSLEMLTRLQKLDFDLKQSGITGFLRGPAEGGLQKYLGVDIGSYFRTTEGAKAAARFIQSLPVTQQLFARDILRQAGEQRFTNKDLTGAQSTLVKLGQSGGFNAGTLRQLTGYLKSLVKSGLSNAGTFDISPATLEKAAMLGIDLKSITPKNNYYSPYFNQGRYAVTNQPIPQYSKQYMDGLRDDGIFGYARMRGTTGGAPMYKLIDVDKSTGLPIQVDPQNPKKGFKTVIVPGGEDWKARLGSGKKRMLDYNRNYLLKAYGLDR